MRRFFVSLCFLCLVSSTYARVLKPNITILGTGGTIAGSATSRTDTTHYRAGTLSVDSLIKAVPALKDVANLRSEQIANVDSNDISDQILLTLSHRINQLLTSGGQDGVVVTHGTDTMVESSFFIDLTVNSPKPVVFVGSMRPATALSADGPMNLLEAVILAGAKNAQNRGTLLMLDDQINSAYYVTKTNSITTGTFKSPFAGALGLFTDKGPLFFYDAARPTHHPYFDVTQLRTLPRVDIFYVYQDSDTALLDAAITDGAKGIVVDATGNGNVPIPVQKRLLQLTEQGFPIIIATRTGSGYVSVKPYGISSGFLDAEKSRVLLQLALATHASITKIKTYFDITNQD